MDTVEKRKLHRPRMLQGGKIVYGMNNLLIDCMIRDRTDMGARLKVAISADVPNQIRLFVTGDNALTPARIIWRSEREIGIEFTGPAEPIHDAADLQLRALRVHA
ncbi:PilZ domain-containing protein [Breoghania sp. L-A4]|uniref:PilZ domain-containing protein n=1 Tax=Breoghania sp. L-A4 TaxID=2304600 RepID=UPI000E358EEE|nr:PilZ domain-containing protein [Breoghania sp. L-A4]AXS40720.1 PilZ domain-containing protein [Breoghania sp. L-A4]